MALTLWLPSTTDEMASGDFRDLDGPVEPESTRLSTATSFQLKGITVHLNRPLRGRSCIKIVIQNETRVKRDFDANISKLRWDFQPPFTIHKGEALTIQLWERARLWTKAPVTQASVSFLEATKKLEDSPEGCKDIILNDDPKITIDLSPTGDLPDATLQNGLDVLREKKTVLGRLGKARSFLEILLELGNATSELHPISRALLGNINVVYKRLEDQDLRNKVAIQLAENMAYALSYVQDVEQFARLAQLKRAIEDIRPLIEDMTNLITTYSASDGIKAALDPVLSSSEKDQIDRLTTRFDLFKQQFDRGVSIQSLATLDQLLASILSAQDDAVLAELKPRDLEPSTQKAGCMDGTRQAILADIEKWTTDLDAPNILWLKGYPGVGKSAIASSIVQRLLSAKRLGSCFFFQRDKATTMSPSTLWRMAAFDLGWQYPAIKRTLVSKLSAREILPSVVGLDVLFQHFIHEPLMTSQDIPAGRLPVIVIDALDECGGLEGQTSAHRMDLMRTVKNWSNLPTKFKLIVTSRADVDIENVLSTVDHNAIEVSSGRAVSSSSSADVRSFLHQKFREIATRYPISLSSDWPGTNTISELSEKAAGLFIWAQTTIKFVEEGDPEEQLDRVLRGCGSGGMVNLYSMILNIAFPHPTPQVLETFHSVFSAVLLSKMPQSIISLAKLLAIKSTTIEYITTSLRSVLDSNQVLRIKHQSFVDFLIDKDACPTSFLIEPAQQNRNLALACLRVMKNNLEFNICRLESSYFSNSDIHDLPLRIEQNIPPYLLYACCFWADHLADAGYDDQLVSCLQQFMENQFLFWLEVMSLCSQLTLASDILLTLISWLKSNHQDDTMAQELRKFVGAFAGVISESVPHIYLSALPFTPRSSVVSQLYFGRYPKTITVEDGGHSDWPNLHGIWFGHQRQINSISISPDGKRVVSGSHDLTIRVWDAETGETIIGPLYGHSREVTAVAFSPDCKLIASGSRDRTLRIWNSESGQIDAGSTFHHSAEIASIAFLPDGKRIAVGSRDGTILLWDVKSCKVVSGPFEDHRSRVVALAVSPDGKRIASSFGDGAIHILDGTTGKLLANLSDGSRESVACIAFSPDGGQVACGSHKKIRVWDSKGGDLLADNFRGHTGTVTSVAFLPDCKYLISGSWDRTIRVWNVENGDLVSGPYEDVTSSVMCIAICPDSNRFISGSHNGTICVWTHGPSEAKTRLSKGHAEWVECIAFSPDGKHIVSGSMDGSIYAWDSVTGRIEKGPFLGCSGEVVSVAYSPNGKRIAAASRDTGICVWDAETGEVAVGPLNGQTELVSSITFSPDGTRIAVGSFDSTIRILDGETGGTISWPFKGHNDAVLSIAFSPDGKWLASGSNDRTVRVWDVETGVVVAGPFEGHQKGISSVEISPDGRRVASGSVDGTIRLWDIESSRTVLGPLGGHIESIMSVSFSPDGRRITSGSADKTICVWNSETGSLVAGPFCGHSRNVTCVAFSPDGTRIASASGDGTIRVWRAEPQKVDTCPLLTDGSSMVNGWILGENSERLLWVPPALRVGFVWPNNDLLIGKVTKTKLNLDNFVHGESWTLCREG
ncbi:WD40 repeat-like protein [Serendipita vermifera]|nr:WD40 repeat-like protein [Serendipita vermifera]